MHTDKISKLEQNQRNSTAGTTQPQESEEYRKHFKANFDWSDWDECVIAGQDVFLGSNFHVPRRDVS